MNDDHLDAFDPDDEWWPDFLAETGLSTADGKNIDDLCQRLREWWVEYREDRQQQEDYQKDLDVMIRTRD